MGRCDFLCDIRFTLLVTSTSTGTMGNRKAKLQTSAQNLDSPTTEIPEDEQWRLINESGILSNVPRAQVTDDEEATPADEIFNAVLLIIPFSFLLLLMEMFVSSLSGEPTLTEISWQSRLIHYQYGKQPSFQALVDRMAPGVPST
jgi:hypothetical protein